MGFLDSMFDIDYSKLSPKDPMSFVYEAARLYQNIKNSGINKIMKIRYINGNYTQSSAKIFSEQGPIVIDPKKDIERKKLAAVLYAMSIHGGVKSDIVCCDSCGTYSIGTKHRKTNAGKLQREIDSILDK